MTIKVLYITYQTQGQRENDFCFGAEGELAFPGPMDCTHETVDGPCGCKRSLTGITSLLSSTTVVVGVFPGNRADLIITLTEALHSGGWFDGVWATALDWPSEISQMADTILFAAQRHPIGTVMERCEDGIIPRQKVEVA